ncbi:hypothetical protein L211DRAFT_835335 [Terfezia boudieri ATCC MYA-4762]|uniref:Uncharacterized protein n=1 Tax=Terfezia boudieri ATCC MYA-4762 TaxID=1051890 RepID=A0A3N4M0N9_9PEZI|nr:hypothetical protein L211DRAFT_835335 [Terfezia boudieri ATCC MYA-4762]
MRGDCGTCSYDPSASASYNVLPNAETIIPDPKTDELALSISKSLNYSMDSAWYGLGRSSTAVKQIMRAKEIVAMMLYLCGFDGDDDSKIAAFLCSAYKHLSLFQSFLHLKLSHYNPPSYKSNKPFPVRSISLGSTENYHTLRHVAILDLLSFESRKQLVLVPKMRPRMCVADAIGLLAYLGANPPWYICEAFHWGNPAKPDKATPLGQQRVQTLAYVVRWLVGLGPYEKIPEGMGQDLRPMWGRVKWLRESNEKDLARFKARQTGWQGWKWLVVLKEQGAETSVRAQE